MNFRKNLAWSAGGQFAFFLIQFLGSVILARLLSPYEFGVNALALATAGVLYILQSVGLGAYIVREIDLTANKIAAASTVNILISILIALATVGLALAGNVVAPDHNVRNVLLLIALSPLIDMFGTVPYALLERRGNFRAISLINLVRGLLTTFVSTLLALKGFSFYSLVAAQIAASLANAIALNAVAWHPAAFRPSVKGWRVIGRFGAQMVATHGINALASRSSEFALGRIRGVTELGLFGRASGIYTLLWNNVHLLIGRVVFTEFARQKREGKSLRELYLLTSELMTATMWPLFAGMAVLSEPVIRIVYGDQWAGAALPFALLAISAIILVSITMTWEVFVVSNATGAQARLEVVRTVIGTGLFVLGACFSLTAAAAARVAEAVVSLFVYRPHLERMTETTLKDMIPIYLRSALLTGLAIGPSMVLMLARGSAAGRTGLPMIVPAVVLGVLAWAVGLRLMRHRLYLEAMRLASGGLRRIRMAPAPSEHLHGTDLD
jgi:O-antigen/teichoic acid export membrane protein